MSEKKLKKTNKAKEQKSFGIDSKWKKKPVDNQNVDGLGVSFEEAMKVLSNPTHPESNSKKWNLKFKQKTNLLLKQFYRKLLKKIIFNLILKKQLKGTQIIPLLY
ncbi:MAG: hypothetical protein V4560_16630 [Bacteroidota bacterium]